MIVFEAGELDQFFKGAGAFRDQAFPNMTLAVVSFQNFDFFAEIG